MPARGTTSATDRELGYLSATVKSMDEKIDKMVAAQADFHRELHEDHRDLDKRLRTVETRQNGFLYIGAAIATVIPVLVSVLGLWLKMKA